MTANREIRINLGDVDLDLKFETENLLALSRITGKDAFTYIRQMSPRKGEDEEAVGARAADLAYFVPLVAAGLAHHKESKRLTTDEMQTKICRLIDAEAVKTKQSVLVVGALAMAKIAPVAALSLAPPGMTVDEIIAKASGIEEKEAGAARSPLDGTSVPSPGTD